MTYWMEIDIQSDQFVFEGYFVTTSKKYCLIGIEKLL